MTGPGDFDQLAREAIYEAGGYRCVGCGASEPLTCQHRIARGMGGTSNRAIGHPANGVALCGSGTTGCHGWTEAHPAEAEALGWRLPRYVETVAAPYWTRHGWRAWNADLTVSYLDDADFTEGPELEAMRAAIAAYEARLVSW